MTMDTPQLANPVRILIVDDHPNTAGMLARVLSRFETPVDVLTASNAEEALALAGERPVEIVITDFMMPGLNGLELIERLQAIQKPPQTILITAYDTPGLAITARRLKVQEYLVKPVQPERIRNLVSRMLDELRPAAERQQITGSRRGYKILIADDYPDNLRLLSTRLQNEGYSFIASWDGEETLRKVRQELPDLVLLDVNMPHKDGFEVLAEMRADPAVAHIPVIMITAARINPRDVRQGFSLGADDYIIKPFDWRELAARIQAKLRVKQAEDILRQRTRELGILPELGQQLSARLDVQELAHIVVERTAAALGPLGARLDIFEPGGRVVSLRLPYSDVSAASTTTAADAAGSAQAEPQAERPSAPVETLHPDRQNVMRWGAVYYVVTTRQGIVVADTRSDARWGGQAGEAVGAAAAVPLLGRQGVIGVFTVWHPQVEHFTLEHQTLLHAIASQAAIAIENAQLFGAELRRVQELMALTDFTREVHAFTHTQQLLESLPALICGVEAQAGTGGVTVSEASTDPSEATAVAQAEPQTERPSAAFGFPAVAVYALSETSVTSAALAGGNGSGAASAGLAVSGQAQPQAQRSFANQPAAAGLQLVSLSSQVDDLDLAGLEAVARQALVTNLAVLQADPAQPGSRLAVPLECGGQLVGVLAAAHPAAGVFQEKDRLLLQTLAGQAGAALERIRLFESVEHQQRRLLAVLRSAADAILVLDGQMRLTLANPAGEALLTDADGFVGRPLPRLPGFDGLAELLEQVHLDGNQRQAEIGWPDGRSFSVLAAAISADGGLVDAMLVVLHDISRFKALAELKDEYIATASHDLKNPIMALMGYNDLLAKVGPLNPMQAEFSQRIGRAALQMRELVLNLLEMSRLEAGMTIKQVAVDIHALIYGVAQDFSEQARQKGHSIALQLHPAALFICGDPALLQQMANNLVGNAIKYTPAAADSGRPGQIVVSTRPLDGGQHAQRPPQAQRRGQVEIVIQDNGLGIPAEALPKLFKKFYRVQTDETRDIEGTGLGLAIVQAIVEKHGGQIGVESEPGMGTRFTVILPAAQGGPEA